MKMRVHTYFKRCMVFFATLCVILISNHSVTWAASGQGNSPMLMVDKYTVENEKIVPGQDFTLTLTLKNYSNTNTAKNIMLNVENPEGVAPVYGTTSQVFVGTLEPEKTKEVSIKYRSWASIQDESLDFTLTIVSDQPTNQVILRIPVGADSPLNIISSSVSTDVQVGESGSAVISFEALAENNQALGREVGENVGDRVLKEMNYLMREREEADEERFRKLDAAIRGNLKKKEPRKWGRKKE